MSDKTIINFKGSHDLKEAIRVLSFKQGHSNKSKTIINILEGNADLARVLRDVKKTSKKVA